MKENEIMEVNEVAEVRSHKINSDSVLSGLMYGLLFVTIVAGAIFVFAFIADLGKLLGSVSKAVAQENAMKQSIVSGVITGKRIENGRVISSGGGGVGYGTDGSVGYYFGGSRNESYIPTTYRIYITNDYEYDGSTYTGEVFFEVSETVYNYYSIGDWFDSQDLNID